MYDAEILHAGALRESRLAGPYPRPSSGKCAHRIQAVRRSVASSRRASRAGAANCRTHTTYQGAANW